MKPLIFLFTLMFKNVYLFNLCDISGNYSSKNSTSAISGIKYHNINKNECSTISFRGSHKIHENLDTIKLTAVEESATSVNINISFSEITWTKAYIKLVNHEEQDNFSCMGISVQSTTTIPSNITLYNNCFYKTNHVRSNDYIIEFEALGRGDSVAKNLLFRVPDIKHFGNEVSQKNKLLFAYVEYTDFYKLLLRIQALPKEFQVKFYKVEVYSGKAEPYSLIDVRLIKEENQSEYTFEYITFNEEGFYYFVTSFITEECPEDKCLKSSTPTLEIGRKGTPLVIGIVGASFIIPFVLFILHLWNRNFKASSETSFTEKNIVIVYKPSSEKHNDVVTFFAEFLTKLIYRGNITLHPVNFQRSPDKGCVDTLILASHIIFVPPPDDDVSDMDFDYMTYNILKEETKKPVPSKDIFVVEFPYCTRNIPSILSQCQKYDMTEDFDIMIKKFVSNEVYLQNTAEWTEFVSKIKLAGKNVDRKGKIKAPIIVITDNDAEPAESDLLL